MAPKQSGTKQPFSFVYDFVHQEFAEAQQRGHHEALQMCSHVYVFCIYSFVEQLNYVY